MKEKSLMLKIEDIPDNVRVILKKGSQASIVSQAIKKFKTIKSLAQRLNVDRSTIYCWKNEWWFMEFKNLKKLMQFLDIDLDKICDQVKGVKGQGKALVLFKQKLPFEIPIELIAHLQGDGSVKKRDGASNYTNEEPFLINLFIESFQKIFITQFNLYKTEDYAQVNLPAVIGKILVLKFGTFESKKFIIPELKNKEYIKRYLRAFFDDEGSAVEDKKQYRYISLHLRNKAALEQIRKFLYKLRINSHIYRYKVELRISGFENLMLFAKTIGFTHPWQKEKLKKLLNNYKK